MIQNNFFKSSEFDSPDAPGSGELMQDVFMRRLVYARECARVPFIINSGYRTAKHNRNVGGVTDSAHTKGYAADIHIVDDTSRFKIVRALFSAGFNRIGIYKTFVHVDCDIAKKGNVIWYE